MTSREGRKGADCGERGAALSNDGKEMLRPSGMNSGRRSKLTLGVEGDSGVLSANTL